VSPGALRSTGGVNAVTGRGRHTSSSVRAINLNQETNTWIIDTPGVRSFGLGHIKLENLLKSFEDLWAIAVDCPRDCSHLADSPDCLLDEAVTKGDIQPGRVDSLRRLMSSLANSSNE
jgi:ribosome biogenesis GTPase